MYRNGTTAALSAALLGCLCGASNAAVLLDINFDSYSNATVIGQDGWFDAGFHASPTGANIVTQSGTDKALELDGVPTQNSYYPARAFSTSANPFGSSPGYASLVLNVQTLPSTTGGHFVMTAKPSGGDPRNALFIRQSTTTAGTFNIGVGPSPGFAPTWLAQDFDPTFEHVVIWKWQGASSVVTTTVWVDPASELSTSATQSGSGIDSWAGAIRFQQARSFNGASQNIGVLEVDNLLVGTSFNDVFQQIIIPEPASAALLGGALLALRRRRHGA